MCALKSEQEHEHCVVIIFSVGVSGNGGGAGAGASASVADVVSFNGYRLLCGCCYCTIQQYGLPSFLPYIHDVQTVRIIVCLFPLDFISKLRKLSLIYLQWRKKQSAEQFYWCEKHFDSLSFHFGVNVCLCFVQYKLDSPYLVQFVSSCII